VELKVIPENVNVASENVFHLYHICRAVINLGFYDFIFAILHTSYGDQMYFIYYGRTYVVKALTRRRQLREEKPLNVKKDPLQALEVHSENDTFSFILYRDLQLDLHLVKRRS